jgi:hypothetical protein
MVDRRKPHVLALSVNFAVEGHFFKHSFRMRCPLCGIWRWMPGQY